MKVFLSIRNNIIYFHLFAIINLIFSQINDNFETGVLEEGNYDLLDVTDYHNMNLVVSTSKNIYTGVPPVKKVETNANLIKFSSLITINENYLLAACLQDSFLGKINLSNGNFISLISYENPIDSKSIQVPQTICSLSNIDDTIFIGYTEIEEEHEQLYRTNTVFKINIINKLSIEEGPSLDTSVDIKHLSFGRSKKETTSLRQISCEALQAKDNSDEYRLICLHESTSIYTFDSVSTLHYLIWTTTIKSDFSDFEISEREHDIEDKAKFSGFRIYRENNTYARCVSGNSLNEIYLTLTSSGERVKDVYCYYCSSPFSSYELDADIDLIAYNNKFTFSAKKTSFMGKNDIYYFQINQNYYPNYFKIYDYQVNNINKILGYYNEVTNKIIYLFQGDNFIKYFMIDNILDIFSLQTYDDVIELGSYHETQYNLKDLVTSPNLDDLGKLNVELVKTEISSTDYLFEYYGIDFYETLMTNNIFIPEPSLNDWRIYYFSFIENIENEYTRIYHLKSFTINLHTCENNCYSCWDGYNTCTDCTRADYAILIDRSGECFPKDYLVDNYIYDSSSNKFLNCYESCEFCSEASTSSSSTDHKCTSCLPGYLYSYTNFGNCYLYTDLDISDEKEFDTNTGIFISSTCSNYKIHSTGECINECPSTSPYYSYEYNAVSGLYERVNYLPPKYSFNKACYEQCPENTHNNENDECVCNNYYYKDNNQNLICLSEGSICPNEYPYLNQDTNECFDSLEKCDYFFGDICYSNNCPSGKVSLSIQNMEIINYIKEKLSLNSNLENKICICDTSNGVWSNINVEKEYYQECLSSCPIGYIPEDITKHCIINNVPSTDL